MTEYPADPALERLVCGIRLCADSRAPELARVAASWFSDPRCAIIWRTVERLEPGPASLMHVGHAIDDIAQIGGWAFLSQLVVDADPGWHLPGIVRRLYHLGLRRAVLCAAGDIAEQAYNARDAVKLAQWARSRLP
ncbi:MAG: hypothetical protein WC700_16265 [Gemmatimonadaceae bacterium]|jgi:hypothetical protein